MERLFKIIDEINRAGLENFAWGCVQEVSTRQHFGTLFDLELRGRWLYACRDKNDEPLCREFIGLSLECRNCDDVVDLYSFDGESDFSYREV